MTTDLLKDSVGLKISRSIEKVLYLLLLDQGYTPDRSILPDPFDSSFDPTFAGYAQAKANIKARKGFCVDLFGHGASMDRKTKFIPRMVITGMGFSPGSVGNDKQPYYKKNDSGKYDKLVGPIFSSNFRFELELCSNKTAQDMFLEIIRATALPQFEQIPVYDQPQDSILIQYNPPRQMPNFGQGLIQRIYTYEVIDVFETMPKTISTEIARVKSITVKITDDGKQQDVLTVPKP